MMELIPPFLQHAIAAAFFAGIGCSIAGVFVVTMHMSFLGVCIAHAAFAGALCGVWLGFSPLAGSIAFSLLSVLLTAPLADREELSPDASIGVIFSLMIGLAFLFLGLTPGARTSALNLFWGSILTVTIPSLILLGCIAFVITLLVVLFFKEIQAVLCHRHVAVAVGIPATVIFYGMLLATGITIAAALPCIGGLLIYSLVINPAAAALQLTYRLSRMFMLAALFGVLSCWAGLAASYWWDLPAGAAIVLSSLLCLILAMLASPKRRKSRWMRLPVK